MSALAHAPFVPNLSHMTFAICLNDVSDWKYRRASVPLESPLYGKNSKYSMCLFLGRLPLGGETYLTY